MLLCWARSRRCHTNVVTFIHTRIEKIRPCVSIPPMAIDIERARRVKLMRASHRDVEEILAGYAVSFQNTSDVDVFLRRHAMLCYA